MVISLSAEIYNPILDVQLLQLYLQIRHMQVTVTIHCVHLPDLHVYTQ